MKNPKNKKVDKLTMGVGAGLVASILLNVVLGVQLANAGGPSDNYTGESATDASIYEQEVKDLRQANRMLEEQVRNNSGTISAQTEESESGKEEEKPAENTGLDATRNAAQTTVSGFLDAYLNLDTSKTDNEKRRAALDPFLNDELLGQLAPNAEELAEMGIEGHTHEGEEDLANAVPDYTYTQELTAKQIFIDDASLETDQVEVVAETTSHVTDDAGSDYDLNDRYSFTLQKEGDNWVIVDYVLEAIENVNEG